MEGCKCWLPQTEVMLVGHSFHNMRAVLRKYMEKRGLNFGPIEEVLHECICAALQRERKGHDTHCEDTNRAVHPELAARQAADRDPRGPHGMKRGTSGADGWAWRQLHLAAIDGKIDKKFIDAFINHVSCGVCAVHARQFVRLNPPPYDAGPDELFRWTWFWHKHANEVAHPKGSAITLEEARHLYHLS